MNPYRSYLFVPAHKAGWAAKGANAGADALILDLEDAVPPDAKAQAREMIPQAIAEARAIKRDIGIVVRVNHWSAAEAALDYDTVVRYQVDAVMVPKIERAVELERIDALLEYAERLAGRATPIEVVATLETARGVVERDAIARAPRVGAVLASTARGADIARSVGFTWTPGGTETLYLRSGVVLAARAVPNCHPIVGLWQEIKDLEGLEAHARANRGLGFLGEVLIHPSHIETVNRVYSPDEAQVQYYRALIAAYEEAVSDGRGAAVYEGEHIDLAHVATAREFVAFAERITAGA
ncbi:MAG TPA: CoA ester lyase [Acidimicrobiales bacterium]|jgi:citrate lyase subunit beta/citryl-CoA lyase|nr:CoA ester lyase [Acidimicrobiales bacterium]